MCGRMQPLTLRQITDALRALAAGEPGVVWRPEWGEALRNVFPGMPVPLILPAQQACSVQGAPACDEVALPGVGDVAAASLEWGFPSPSDPRKPVFNTRIETALRDVDRGWGFWEGPVEHGRCVVPCRWFYEPSSTETVTSPRTGRPIKRQYEFRSPGQEVTYLAAVQQEGRFSVVTTAPNADMEDVHPRMPLVLRPEELASWFGAGYRLLADRSAVRLESRPEDLGAEVRPEPGEGAQGRLF